MPEPMLPLIHGMAAGVRNTRDLPWPALQPGFGAHELLSVTAPAPGMGPEQGAISKGNRLCQQQAELPVCPGRAQAASWDADAAAQEQEGRGHAWFVNALPAASSITGKYPLGTSPSHPAILGLPSPLSPTAAVDGLEPRAEPAFPLQNLHRWGGFPALPGGLRRRMCVGKDTVSLGLAVKCQRRAGSSLWAGWKCQQG